MPHWTSSTISSQPRASHSLRNARRYSDAAFALQHLEPHRLHPRIGRRRRLDRGDVVVRHADEPRRQRIEPLARLLAAGGGERSQRAAVPGVLHHDRLRLRVAALVAVHAHQLQRPFVGLGAGVGEEHLVHPGQRADAVGQRLLLGDAVDVRDVDQAADLLGQRSDQLRMRVAEPVHGDACQRVQVLPAVLVRQPRPLAAREGDRQAGVGVHQV
jgi:hypothetical protein